MEWFFNGLGTTIISLIVGVVFGGSIGYKIGISKSVNQKQKAGRKSTQSQIGEINHGK